MTPFHLLVFELGVFLLAMMALESGEAILCVRCNSWDDTRDDTDCDKKLPWPTHCQGGSEVTPACSKIRQFDARGNMVRLVRSCSTTVFSGCSPNNFTSRADVMQPGKVCYDVCTEDGCNGAPSTPSAVDSNVLIRLSVSVLLALGVSRCYSYATVL